MKTGSNIQSRNRGDRRLLRPNGHQDIVNAAFIPMARGEGSQFEIGCRSLNQCVHDWNTWSLDPLPHDAIILQPCQRKRANRRKIFNADTGTIEGFREAVSKIACLTHETLLRVVGKTNRCLLQSRRIAKINLGERRICGFGLSPRDLGL